MGRDVDSCEDLSVEQKFAKVMLQLRNIRPFYSAIYEIIKKSQDDSIKTMAVGVNDLIYNYEFVKRTPFDEFLFTNLHEIAHIALQHVARLERRNRMLWNIAADLYINQALKLEFNLEIGTPTKIDGYIRICAPGNSLYCTSIDLNTDYVEKIYKSLEKQAVENGYLEAYNNILHQGGPRGPRDPLDILNSRLYHFEYTGSLDSEQSRWYSRSKEDGKYWTFRIDLDPNDDCRDLKNSTEPQAIKDQQSRKLLSDAIVRSDMNKTSKSSGDGTAGIEVLSMKLIKSQIDWRRLLKQHLTLAYSKDSSFNMPDKRMYYQNAIYPGQVSEDYSNLSGLKVCIDTSGSVEDDDLYKFFYQVESLTRQFKLEAELLYWDSEVKSAGYFSRFSEFSRIDCCGRGGTDPSCVFQRFISNKEKPLIVLMLTDGVWSRDWVTPKIRKQFKNTIWVITEDCIDSFEPPFGKKAVIKYS